MFSKLRLKLIPLIRFLGKLQAPWVTKKITGYDYEEILSKIRPGDILLTRALGFFSNFLIPGYWKHVGVMCEGNYVVEALGDGVVKTYLADFVLSKDSVMVVRPTFCNEKIACEASREALNYVGANYDYEFELDNEAFYCSELAYQAYKVAAGEAFGFELRERLGVKTVTADDFAEAVKWWAPIFDSRGNRG